MEQLKILDSKTARRAAMGRLNKEVTDEYATADIQATVRLLAEGFRPGLSPSSLPDISNRPPIVPEEFRPDPT